MTACSVMPTDMKPGGKHGVNSLSADAKNTIFQGYAQVALTELYAQQGTIDVPVIATPARDARAVAEKNYKVGGLELIMWSQRLQPKIDKPDTDKTKAGVTEIEVKHPYGVAKFQADAAKYSEFVTALVSPFWYVIKKRRHGKHEARPRSDYGRYGHNQSAEIREHCGARERRQAHV